MPFALERLDLSDYDLIISSESGPAKGVLTPPGSMHICYCHSPMRYLWDLTHEYRRNAGFAGRLGLDLFGTPLRMWDQATANRVDHFVANSRHVAARIWKFYRREARVIHPPVAVEDFRVKPEGPDDFYLFVGQLVPYKRARLAVEAFNRMGKRLVVIGAGEELAALRRMAGTTVEILGSQPFPTLVDHYARCRALVFPNEEDFGLVPVEAMASGRPVIAYNRGGATETVVDGETGILFDDASVDGLIAAVDRFEGAEGCFSVDRIVAHARNFSSVRFREAFQSFVRDVL
jgi:glycosyltransferase involved in cell wall biosynthesis